MATEKSYAERTAATVRLHCERRGIVEVDAVLAELRALFGGPLDALSNAQLRDLNRMLPGVLDLYLAPADWADKARSEVHAQVAKGLGKTVAKMSPKEKAVAERRLVQQVAAHGGPVKRRPPVVQERPKGGPAKGRAAAGGSA